MIDIDIGTTHRLIAFKRPLNLIYYDLYYGSLDTLEVNFSTDHNNLIYCSCNSFCALLSSMKHRYIYIAKKINIISYLKEKREINS